MKIIPTQQTSWPQTQTGLALFIFEKNTVPFFATFFASFKAIYDRKLCQCWHDIRPSIETKFTSVVDYSAKAVIYGFKNLRFYRWHIFHQREQKNQERQVGREREREREGEREGGRESLPALSKIVSKLRKIGHYLLWLCIIMSRCNEALSHSNLFLDIYLACSIVPKPHLLQHRDIE